MCIRDSSKNAQIYYKKYGKAKTAVKEKKIQLEEVSQEIDYLESVLEFTEKAHSVEELRTIRQELTDSGFLRYRKNRNTKEKPSKPSPYTYTPVSYTHLDVYKRQIVAILFVRTSCTEPSSP